MHSVCNLVSDVKILRFQLSELVVFRTSNKLVFEQGKQHKKNPVNYLLSVSILHNVIIIIMIYCMCQL